MFVTWEFAHNNVQLYEDKWGIKGFHDIDRKKVFEFV